MAKQKEQRIEDVPISAIRRSTFNRVVSMDDPTVHSLAQSMREDGLIQPIVLREAPKRTYEIVCGERRWCAAQLLEWETIPAIVRERMNDADAHVLRLTENLQRADVPPLEQSKGVATLLEALGDVTEVARRLGQSEEWVRFRARLRNLSETWRSEIMDPHTPYPLLASFVTWQETLARLPQESQEQLWQQRVLLHAQTLDEVKRRIQRTMRLISTAPWADNTPLFKICRSCRKRSDHADVHGLFADVTSAAPSSDGYCLDPACWRLNCIKRMQLQMVSARNGNRELVFLHTSATPPELTRTIEEQGLEVIYQWWKYDEERDAEEVEDGCVRVVTGCVVVPGIANDPELDVFEACVMVPRSDGGGDSEEAVHEPTAAQRAAVEANERKNAMVHRALANARNRTHPAPEDWTRILVSEVVALQGLQMDPLEVLQATPERLEEMTYGVLEEILDGCSLDYQSRLLPLYGVDASM